MSGMANATEADLVKLGYRVVLDGELEQMRRKVGMSRNAQACLIGVEGESLKRWEELTRSMNIETALRVGEWFWGAQKVLDDVADIDFGQLVPASRAAQHMGMPQTELEEAILLRKIKHENLGNLGIFIYREALAA